MNASKQVETLNGFRSRVQTMAGTQPRFEILSVTPAIAAKWLERNTKNQRPISAPTVEMYARDMAAGRWQLTPQGVAFNRSGELVDGQHRLHAIIKAGASVEMVVATGFVVEYDSPLDQGRLRTVGQILHRDNRWVSIVRCTLLLEGGQVAAKSKVSLGEISATYDRHRESIDVVFPEYRKLPGGVSAAIAWALPLDQGKVLSFATQVRDGELLERGDPAFGLRNWLSRNTKAAPYEFMYATANTIRALLQGETMSSVYTGSTGYRWLCQRRRAEGIPHTPSPALVQALGTPNGSSTPTRR